MLGCPMREFPSIMSAKSGNSLATVLVAAAIVAALYFGREVLLPMALAVLLSFVLAPPVKLLQRFICRALQQSRLSSCLRSA